MYFPNTNTYLQIFAKNSAVIETVFRFLFTNLCICAHLALLYKLINTLIVIRDSVNLLIKK